MSRPQNLVIVTHVYDFRLLKFSNLFRLPGQHTLNCLAIEIHVTMSGYVFRSNFKYVQHEQTPVRTCLYSGLVQIWCSDSFRLSVLLFFPNSGVFVCSIFRRSVWFQLFVLSFVPTSAFCFCRVLFYPNFRFHVVSTLLCAKGADPGISHYRNPFVDLQIAVLVRSSKLDCRSGCQQQTNSRFSLAPSEMCQLNRP